MDLINSALEFIKNPDNSWILYSIAAFMVVDGFIMRIITKYLPNISQSKDAEKSSKLWLIKLSALVTAISGVTLAIATFYFTQIQ